MNRLRCILVVFCLVLSHTGHAISGDGHVTMEKRIVTDFRYLTVNGPFEIVFTDNPQSDFFVKVETDKNLQDYITVYQDQFEVKVNLRPGVTIDKFTRMVLHIDNKDLHSVTINSNSITGAHGTINRSKCSTMHLKVTGSTPVDLDLSAVKLIADINNERTTRIAGEIKDVAIIHNGNGQVSAFGLVSDNIRVKNNGAGAVEIYSNVDIKIENTVSSYIYYKGGGNVSELKEVINGSSCRENDSATKKTITKPVASATTIKKSSTIGFNTDSLFAVMMERDQRHRQIKIGDTMHTAADDAENFVCLKWYFNKYGYPELHTDSLMGLYQTLFMHIDNYENFEQIKSYLLKGVKAREVQPNTYAYSCDRSMIAGHKRPVYYYFFQGSDWDKQYKPTKAEIAEVNKQRKLIGLPDYPLLLNGKYF